MADDDNLPHLKLVPKPSPTEEEAPDAGAAKEDTQFIRVENLPLWEKWNKDALMTRYNEIGPREFERGFRQRPIADSERMFTDEAINAALDRTTIMPDSIQPGNQWFSEPRDAGVDLAVATAEREAAFFSICGIATTKDWHRWILTIFFARGLGLPQQIGHLVEFQDRFGFQVVNVERNGYQNILVRYFKEEGMEGRVPVYGLYTGAPQKRDLEIGIPGMATEWSQGRWHIPYGDARSRRMAEPFIEELKMYPNPGYHDDGIMASFFAREARLRNFRPKMRVRMIKF